MTTRREVIALYRAGAAFAHAARIRATASLVSTGRKTRLTSVAACGRWNEKELASAAAAMIASDTASSNSSVSAEVSAARAWCRLPPPIWYSSDRRAGFGAELRLVHPQEHARSRA